MSQLRRWKKFTQTHPQEATHILSLVLPSCEALHGYNPHEQAEIVRTDVRCKDLYDLLRSHRSALALPDDDLAYAAFALKLCYCIVVKAEANRANQ